MKYIKIDGKRQSKFSLCSLMGFWKNLPWTVMCDAFDYSYISSRFIEFAAERGIKYDY